MPLAIKYLVDLFLSLVLYLSKYAAASLQISRHKTEPGWPRRAP